MQEHSLDHLQAFALLAREYEQKYNDLVEMTRGAMPDAVHQQLKIRAELTTDRFRAVQQAIFSMLLPETAIDREELLKAGTALSRCFDEMRVLFQVLLEYSLGQYDNDPS